MGPMSFRCTIDPGITILDVFLFVSRLVTVASSLSPEVLDIGNIVRLEG